MFVQRGVDLFFQGFRLEDVVANFRESFSRRPRMFFYVVVNVPQFPFENLGLNVQVMREDMGGTSAGR